MFAKHTPLAMTLIAGCIATPAMADFIEDSHLTLEARNFYMNRDWRDDHPSGKHKLEEWGQGFMLRFNSGYTEGPVGFGVDALGLLGIKLDAGGGTNGTGALLVQDDDEAADEFSSLGLTAKMRAGKSVLTLGTHESLLPLSFRNDTRLLPQTFDGAQIVSRDLDKLTLTAGQFRSTRLRDSTDNQDMTMFAFAKGGGLIPSKPSDRFNYAGVTYDPLPNLRGTYYYAELKDNYSQHYLNLIHTLPLAEDWRLKSEVRYFHSEEQGNSGVDNRTLGSMFTLGYKGHNLGVGYQNQSGSTGMPFLGGGTDPWAFATVTYHHFLYAEEDTWQIRYDLDLATVGVPGLTLMSRYLKGDNFQVGNANADERELNTDLTYTVQKGPLKDVYVRWRNVSYRGSHTVDNDENRLIVGYTFKFW